MVAYFKLYSIRLRTFREESTIIYPLSSYQTWIDAGKLEPLIPDHPDPEYNANAWRHFSSREGVRTSSEGRRISALIASMYPLNMPPPSRMGEFTYADYIQNGNVFRDPLRKQKKITWTQQQLAVRTNKEYVIFLFFRIAFVLIDSLIHSNKNP